MERTEWNKVFGAGDYKLEWQINDTETWDPNISSNSHTISDIDTLVYQVTGLLEFTDYVVRIGVKLPNNTYLYTYAIALHTLDVEPPGEPLLEPNVDNPYPGQDVVFTLTKGPGVTPDDFDWRQLVGEETMFGDWSDVTGSGNTFTITGKTGFDVLQSYTYQGRARKNDEYSVGSNEVQVRWGNLANPILVVTPASPLQAAGQAYTVSWAAIGGATQYRIFTSPQPNFPPADTTIDVQTGISKSYTENEPTKRYVRVQAEYVVQGITLVQSGLSEVATLHWIPAGVMSAPIITPYSFPYVPVATETEDMRVIELPAPAPNEDVTLKFTKGETGPEPERYRWRSKVNDGDYHRWLMLDDGVDTLKVEGVVGAEVYNTYTYQIQGIITDANGAFVYSPVSDKRALSFDHVKKPVVRIEGVGRPDYILEWDDISQTTRFTVDEATDASFLNVLRTFTVSGTPKLRVVSGINTSGGAKSTYFRVRAEYGTGEDYIIGEYSDTVTVTWLQRGQAPSVTGTEDAVDTGGQAPSLNYTLAI